MDVALFVGFAERRADVPVAASIKRWLEEAGWTRGPYKRDDEENPTLVDVPVPIDRWETFDRHFAWDRRDGLSAPRAGTYLGAAVRSFFAQGGRACYVVALAPPKWSEGSQSDRLTHLAELLPGVGVSFDASPVDRALWRGAAHVLGLPDVSLLCLPDLAALCAADVAPPAPPVVPSGAPEVFVECSTPSTSSTFTMSPPAAGVPRCNALGYDAWATFVARAGAMLARHAREVEFVAALPIPLRDEDTALAEEDLHAFLLTSGGEGGAWSLLPRLESSFVQIVYPWVKTPASALLPGGVESPDAVLAGVLARNAIARGTFRSAMGAELADVFQIFPLLERSAIASRPRASMLGPVTKGGHTKRALDVPLVDRISLLGTTPSGLRLLSDVTTSPDEAYRQGGLQRLVSVLTRALRDVGAAIVFEPANTQTHARIVRRIEGIVTRLWELGALRGAAPEEAFSVRCDDTTTTQADVDAGRLVAEIEFLPAHAIERIRVTLTLREDGAASLGRREAP
ncbi:phage tail sheath protein [Polyangium mundeleinium]|uniref:Phage tail sheath protein n=1 Tax=Polyangium mundeleinium TaxID=2995306 RepID=A0ABT5F473_9BACT|nr:phage tail sheath protein [Polyangium mundeleinium]MDC0747865.1 phage tail sheath protein [Polyangium mundeleinium]